MARSLLILVAGGKVLHPSDRAGMMAPSLTTGPFVS